MTIVNKRLGEKIRKFRENKEITQEEAAYRAGLDYSYYNQIEMGKRNPSVKALSKIAKVLGVNIKDLF
jgi:transcriptional regulator with XRE-family HTH domain